MVWGLHGASRDQCTAVEFVEVDQVVSISQVNAPDNDPLLPKQWGMSAVRSPAGWTTTRGAPGVRICVVDTGLDTSHPDIQANVRSPGTLVHIHAVTLLQYM